jgi:two-component system sensor histidine kinase KdpD
MHVSTATPQTSRPILGAAVGLAGVVVLNACFIAFDPHITRAVPMLLLLIPVTVASLIGGWKASVPLAVLTACVYSFHFVAPIGVVSLGYNEDTLTMVTFVLVAVVLSALGNRREARRSERERQRAVLLRSVSHDLRNPLGTIRAASAELRGDAIKDEATRNQLLDLVVDESERLDRIVRNLLSLARIEAGALSPSLAAESLGEIVTDSVARLQRSNDNGHTQRVLVDIPDDMPDVLVDRTQLDQVMTNLIENARQHGVGTDEVHVTARCAKDDKNMAIISVSDTGPGFSPAAKVRAFTFFQPSGDTGVEGVGLAVCRAIIEAHGGIITIDDEPGGGARIEFSLPTAGRHAARADR